MDMGRIMDALVLGVVEGITEFLPVSSTGHILLLGHFLGFTSTGRTFEVLIQLGAILAILTVYASRLTKIAMALPHDPTARRFVIGVLVAFLPAAVIGVLAHGFIKTVLFETPMVVCIALVIGGLVLIWVDNVDLEVRHTDVTALPLHTYFLIGLAQCLAMIPGVSRSGSSIVAALLLGADKKVAAEFSFFLAMPTMAGAFVYDVYKNRDALTGDDIMVTAVGFASAFVMAVIVVRGLLAYLSRHGYSLFGWWRIVVGSAGIAGLLVFG
ncbi:undecaprenyl-diphosphate phosphatase [Terrihabitans rhizophilus]|uniref:Undecaprenyl-diphosphatase n=1 Tax=Terrihabitans rhizophilus TaxID=3092662 RepID=A0ABU4RI86_9HYPH|nr:undecaprenyl-diphosphate phosphatase [Terrihabitans sp. PJ23]MDX6804542.1 undecaprenyl-diphosphate phosphatase [Terrihabitans sp. PJ23]